MMNRSRFLALFGLLPLTVKGQKANSTTCQAGSEGQIVCNGNSEGQIVCNGTTIESGGVMGHPKPKNGECPVCRTMAPPYKRKTEREFYGTDVCLPRGEGNTTFAVCDQPSKDKLVGPMERTTRCTYCSAAFWQDAEK